MTYNIYAEGLRIVSTLKATENGAIAYTTTDGAVVDLFATIGAMRNGDDSEERLSKMIARAAAEDSLLTAKTLFYARDIRGGLGERRVFRSALYICAMEHPELVEPNLDLVPEYGRWDDLFSLIGTPLEDTMWAIIDHQLMLDVTAARTGRAPSLLAKWMPSAKTSSKETMALARYAAKKLDLSVYEYKRVIRDIRARLRLLEQDMTAGRWSEIDYGHLPSQAHMRHVGAFQRHDGERYCKYMDDVSKGEEKINTGTLFPYEIIERLTWDEEANRPYYEMWRNLPDYVGDGGNVLVIADTSGSMLGRPITVSTSLAMYFAERNKGPFANMYMTFSERPQLIAIDPTSSLLDRYEKMKRGPWGMNTDLKLALDLLLYVAKRTEAPQEDMPKSIVVITDMEIDQCAYGEDAWNTIVDVVEKDFAEAGYKMPNIVFWNVASRHDTYLAKSNRKGIQLVSGSSPSVFKAVLGFIDGMTPTDAVRQILSTERYAPIKVGQRADRKTSYRHFYIRFHIYLICSQHRAPRAR